MLMKALWWLSHVTHPEAASVCPAKDSNWSSSFLPLPRLLL